MNKLTIYMFAAFLGLVTKLEAQETTIEQIYSSIYPGVSLPAETIDIGLFSETDGEVTVEAKYSVFAINFGYYQGNTKNILIFNASSGKSNTFQASGNFGFYIEANGYTWYSESDSNSDNYDHLKIYSTPYPDEWFLAWEDLSGGG